MSGAGVTTVDNLKYSVRRSYGLLNAELIPIRTGQGGTELFDVQWASGRGFLRLYGDHYRDKMSWVVSGVKLLKAAENAGVRVSSILETHHGEPVGEYFGRPMTLCGLLAGAPAWPPTVEQARSLGQTLARFHLAVASEDISNGRHLDVEELVGRPAANLRRLLAGQDDILQKLGKLQTSVTLAFESLASKPTLWGPIHGNLMPAAVLYDQEEAILLESPFAGIGPLAFDVASYFAPLTRDSFDRAYALEPCRHFLEGYHEVRPLCEEEVLAFPNLLWARLLWELSIDIASRPVLPTLGVIRAAVTDVLRARCAHAFADVRFGQL